MLSALVFVPPQTVRGSAQAEAVVRTLSALVPAAIEGIVRDVAIAAAAGHEHLPRVADHAGCALLEDDNATEALRRGLEAAHEPLILVLRSGVVPEHGFAGELADFLADGGRNALLREQARAFHTRLFPDLAPVAGVIATREHLLSRAAKGPEALWRGHRGATTLRVRARRID